MNVENHPARLQEKRIAELERRVNVLFELMEENVEFAKTLAELLAGMRDAVVEDDKLRDVE
jgi:hypothetical protein